MVVAFTYVLFGIALVIVFGCFYVAWAILRDLAAGWSEACRCGRFPRQFGIGLLFAVTGVAAIACFLLQGARVEGLGQAIVMFAISLAWAAAIIYAVQCMLNEYHRGTRLKGAAGRSSDADEPTDPQNDSFASPGNDDSAVELERWLSAQVGRGSNLNDRERHASTKAMRSHFRVQPSEGPKGVKFGRV